MLLQSYFIDKEKYQGKINPEVFKNVENMASTLDDILRDSGRQLSKSVTTVMVMLQEFMVQDHISALNVIGILKEYWERDGNGEKLDNQHEILSIEKAKKMEELI
ncbi:MAG: hypothetical protein WCL18_10930 [bacterium]